MTLTLTSLAEDERRWTSEEDRIRFVDTYTVEPQTVRELLTAIRTRDEALRRAWGERDEVVRLLYRAVGWVMLVMPKEEKYTAWIQEARTLLTEIGKRE